MALTIYLGLGPNVRSGSTRIRKSEVFRTYTANKPFLPQLATQAYRSPEPVFSLVRAHLNTALNQFPGTQLHTTELDLLNNSGKRAGIYGLVVVRKSKAGPIIVWTWSIIVWEHNCLGALIS